MAGYLRRFREHGGSVHVPPHQISQRRVWMAIGKRYREEWDDLPAVKQDDDLKRGLAFMWWSVKRPRCMVAVLNSDLVAALCYHVRLNTIEVEVAGSRRLEAAKGAGTALEFALAEEAVRREMGVRSAYSWTAVNFHLRIGRRLDVRIGGSSDWTPDDCRFLVKGIKELL
jgi:hypothetical protein